MMANPAIASTHCIEVFEALGETDSAQAALEDAHHELMRLAQTINVPDWRKSFPEAVPENRSLLERWERMEA
jgi:hypothetical protein